MNIARNEKALTRKQGAIPTSAMIVPASAGPRMREQCTTTRVQRDRVDARGPSPTISTTNDCRDGLSIASTEPRTSTSARTIHGSAAPRGGQREQRQRRDHQRELRVGQHAPLRQAVGEQAAPGAEQQDRQELEPGGQADRRRRTR